MMNEQQDEQGRVVSKVTIITQIDLTGLPAAIVNAVQVVRPLLLANMQRCIREENITKRSS